MYLNPQSFSSVCIFSLVFDFLVMAHVFGFSRDVTGLLNSYWDWRYRLVRAGGKTPSASAMPLLVPPHNRGSEPITQNMKRGKFHIQHMEHGESESTNINIWQACRDYGGWRNMNCNLIKSFDCCTSDDVSPCNLVALCSTCDACEPAELQSQRTCF